MAPPPDPSRGAGPARLAAAFARERGRLTAFVRARLARYSEFDPDDVVAEAVARLLERGDLLAEVDNLTAYLFRTVANGLTDLVRRHRRTEELPAEQPDDAPTPDQAAERAQMLRRVAEALESLSVVECEVWTAVEIEGFTYRELAELWRQPIGTLLSRKSRAEKALRERLAGAGRRSRAERKSSDAGT